PAAVLDLERRLLQQKALLRILLIDSRPDSFEVEVRLVAEKGKLEAMLAANRTMAVRARASAHREDRRHVLDEADLRLFLRRRDRDRHNHALALARNAQARFAVAGGGHEPVLRNGRDRACRHLEYAIRRDVALTGTHRDHLARIASGELNCR